MVSSVQISVPPVIIQLMTEIGLIPVLKAVIPDGTKVWLSGGALRDGFLGYNPSDFDFTCSVAPTEIARAFSRQVSGSCFMLDEERLQYRVVWSHDRQRFTADFAPLRGSDIYADLRDRDFTLNAMAWELTSGNDHLLDPLGGLESLHAAELKMCTKGAFENDPVRALRGVRLAATHGLKIEAATFDQMRISGQYLKYSPGERLRDELVKLFAVDCAESLDQLRLLGIEGLIFGVENDLRSWHERIAAVKRYEQRLADLLLAVDFPTLQIMATTRINDDIKRQTFLKLCCFYRLGGPLQDDWFGGRLRLSRRNGEVLGRLINLEDTCSEGLSRVADNSRARALWAAGLDTDSPSALVLLALLNSSDDSFRSLEQVATDWLSHDRDGHISTLMNGGDIQTLLPEITGPQTGDALRLLQEAEIRGDVFDAASAAEYLIRNREKVFDNNLS